MFITFKHLQADLKKFFKDNFITENILDRQWIQFSNLLLDIYSDTPLEFYPGNKRVLKIRKPEKLPKTGEFSVVFDIVEIMG